MVSSYDLRLTLTNKRPQCHTNLEVLRGDVTLNVRKQIEIESVEIAFEGLSRTQTMSATKTEVHCVVSRKQVLFPLPGTQNAGDSKRKFKLTPGVYDYHFEIPVPYMSECGNSKANGGHLICPLPPSVTAADFNVDYELKATVKTASRLKSNITTHRYLVFRPFDPIDEMLSNSLPMFVRKEAKFTNMTPAIIPETPTRGKEVPFAFEVRIDSPYMTLGKPPNFRLFITSKHSAERYKTSDGRSSGLGKFSLQNIVIDLKCIVSIKVEMESGVIGRAYPLVRRKAVNSVIDLAKLVPSSLAEQVNNLWPYELELPRQMYETIEINSHTAPTFKSCNIDLSYVMNIVATFTSPKQGQGQRVMTAASVPIKLLSGVPPPQEYLQAQNIPPEIAADFLTMYGTARETQGDDPSDSVQPLPLYQPPPSYDAPPSGAPPSSKEQ